MCFCRGLLHRTIDKKTYKISKIKTIHSFIPERLSTWALLHVETQDYLHNRDTARTVKRAQITATKTDQLLKTHKLHNLVLNYMLNLETPVPFPQTAADANATNTAAPAIPPLTRHSRRVTSAVLEFIDRCFDDDGPAYIENAHADASSLVIKTSVHNDKPRHTRMRGLPLKPVWTPPTDFDTHFPVEWFLLYERALFAAYGEDAAADPEGRAHPPLARSVCCVL